MNLMDKSKGLARTVYEIHHGNHQPIRSIEGLRAIAAMMVFIVHYAAQFTPWIDQRSMTWSLIVDYRFIGAKGVELFFVISGFLIYGILIRKKIALWDYFKKRIRRIYPTFLSVLVLYIVLSFVFQSENKIPATLNDAVIYIIANIMLLPGVFDIKPIMTVAWSLSYEMFLYLTAPIVVLLFGLQMKTPTYRIGFFSLLSVAGFVLMFNGYDEHEKMVLFFSGILLYEITQVKQKTFSNALIGSAFIITLIIALMVKKASDDSSMITLVLFVGFFLTMLSSFNANSLFGKLCASTPLRYFGNMSYSYYLIHGITLKFFFLLLAAVYPPSHQWDLMLYALLLPVFALTCVTSTILFVMVEKPFSLVTKNTKSTEYVRSN